MIYQYKCRVLPLKKAAEQKIQEQRAAAVSSFKSMLRDSGDINTSSRWSRVGAVVRATCTYVPCFSCSFFYFIIFFIGKFINQSPAVKEV